MKATFRRSGAPVPAAIMATLLLGSCRSAPPATDASPPRFDLPAPEVFSLPNGLEVWFLRSTQVPLASATLVVRAGSTADPEGKEGLAALTAEMLDEGAGERGALEIADEIDHLGAELATSAQKESVQVSIQVLDRNLDPALDILADVLVRPTFSRDEWERVKSLWVNDLYQRREEAADVARVTGERAFYGEAHPFAHPSDGYPWSVEAILLEDVRAFWREHFRPENAVLLFAGGLATDDLRARIEKRFGGWRGEGSVGSRRLAPAPQQGPRLVVVDKPDAPQTEIRILVPAPAATSPILPYLTLQNLIFGGTFTSRIVTNLRERNGFTYGASSHFTVWSVPGHLVARSAVHAEKTGAALVELSKEFRRMEAAGPDAAEVEKAVSTFSNRICEALQTESGSLGIYVDAAALGLSPRERREFYRRVLAARDPGPAEEARRAFRWDAATTVLVGDRRLIEGQLRDIREAGTCPLAPLEVRDRDGARLPP